MKESEEVTRQLTALIRAKGASGIEEIDELMVVLNGIFVEEDREEFLSQVKTTVDYHLAIPIPTAGVGPAELESRLKNLTGDLLGILDGSEVDPATHNTVHSKGYIVVSKARTASDFYDISGNLADLYDQIQN